MSICDDPKRLAMLLASVKSPSRVRPLTPIETAEWLQEVAKEVGDYEAMNRVGLKEFMWNGFKQLGNITEDIENAIIWGASNPKTSEIGFSAARAISVFEPKEQEILVNTMWDYEKPLGYEGIRRIRSYYKENPDKSLQESIAHILKLDRPKKTVISIFISRIDPIILKNLKKYASENNETLENIAKKILSKRLPKDSIIRIKINHTLVKITFSESGKYNFNKLFADTKNTQKRDFVNHLFVEAGL